RRRHVAIGIGDYAHHDQTRHNKRHVIDAIHRADFTADPLAENNKIQGHGDGRRQQGLPPAAHTTPGSPYQHGVEGNPLNTPYTHALLPRTRPTNNSSRRLDLVRMLRTSIPRSVSKAKIRLMLWPFSTVISKPSSAIFRQT